MKNTKVVVITGASRGLGLTLAKEFANSGWGVIGTGRSAQPSEFPDDAVYEQFDASNAETCVSFWKQLRDRQPDTTICLINNAGGYVSGSLTETNASDYAQQMQSSYFSAVYMTQGMALAIPSARIINIISTSALTARKNDSAYGAAKAAEMHFFQSLQQEFKPEQYQVTNLYPSDIASHGPNPDAMSTQDLSNFVRTLAESETTLYLRDATIYSKKITNTAREDS